MRWKTSSWGISLEVKVYTDEETAVMDCKMARLMMPVVATGVRLQRFNNYQQRLKPLVLYQHTHC